MSATKSGDQAAFNTAKAHDDTAQAYDDNDGIAVIGMSCRFPGAKTVDEFWNNLKNGEESITFFTDKELLDAGVNPSYLADRSYVKAGAVLENIEQFDCRFFGYSPKEVELIDPQQRIFLECTWECFEDAGYVPHQYDGRVGVFGGMRISTYLQYLLSKFNRFGTASSFQTLIGNDKDYLANRVSYKLNLKGPSVTVQTACSTSLVAVHMAAESLYSGECDMAVAGGAAVSVPQIQGYFYQEDMIFSPDGHCRPFDASAQGIIGGNGAGAVLLKPLSKAVEDRDHIYAVIKGSAINNDGNAKAGYTAPSIEGQASVISEALALSGANPKSISYVEAHGTGTPLGDPIELEALSRVYKDAAPKNQCAIGSVKGNFGHLDTAAGIASLIKTALALKHKQIPPSLHFKEPNPRIDFQKTPFFVNTALRDWQRNGLPRRAGVSSFGIGGTNAHAVLEEGPIKKQEEPPSDRAVELLLISGKSEQALNDYCKKYRDYLDTVKDVSFADVAYTAAVGREHSSHRIALVARSAVDAKQALDRLLGDGASGGVGRDTNSNSAQKTVFLFTGQGSQYPRMGKKLYETQPVFREAVDACAAILDPLMEMPLTDLLFNEDVTDENPSKLHQTRWTQPALFSIEYALAKMWQSWGIEPDAVMGHSVGEYVAAVVAGIFSLEDGLALIEARGRLMQQLPKNGAMAAVFAEEAAVMDVIKQVGEDVSVAAYNGPALHVISGLSEKVDKVVDALENKGIEAKRLTVSHAFHSSLMTPMTSAFEAIAGRVSYRKPQMDIVLNVTGKLSSGDEAACPDYWRRQITAPVRFSDGMRTLFENGYRLFLEIGPHPVLSGMGRRCIPEEGPVFLSSLVRDADPWRSIASSLGTLYTDSDAKIDWNEYYKGQGARRVSLPTYPFQRRRVWVSPEEEDLPLEKGGRGDLEKAEPFDAALVKDIEEAVQAYGANEIDESNESNYKETEALLTKSAAYYIAGALKRLDAFEDPDERFCVESFLFQTPLLPRYRQLMSWLLEGMAKEGYLKKEDDEYWDLKEISDEDATQVIQTLKKSELFAENQSIPDAVCAYGEKLDELLSGAGESETEGLYGNLSSIGEFVYQRLYPSHYHNGLIAKILERITRVVPSSRKIRILEIGGGTGAVTKSVLKQLDPDRTEYLFTDLSSLVVETAEDSMADAPFVKHSVLDIQQDIESQGFKTHQYDIAIAADVLHSTRDVEESLQHIRSLLAPGGVLIVKEAARHRLFYDFLFGAFDQEIEDEALRGEKAYPCESAWRSVLSDAGFTGIVSMSQSEVAGEFVMAATSEESKDSSVAAAFSEPAMPEDTRDTLSASKSLDSIGPFRGRRLSTALPVFDLLIRPFEQELLSAYTVLSNSVSPVSQYFEIAYFIAAELLSDSLIALFDFCIHEPMAFADKEKSIRVQAVCTHKTLSEVSFKVFSEVATDDPSDSQWLLHFSFSAKPDALDAASERMDSFSALNDADDRIVELTQDEIFSGFEKRGIAYNGPLKKLRQITLRGSEVSGNADGFEANLKGHRAACVLVESCIQAAMTLVLDHEDKKQQKDGVYFPTKLEDVRFFGEIPPSVKIRALLRQNDEDADGVFSVSCFVQDENGRALGEISRIALARFSPKDIERSFQGSIETRGPQPAAKRSQDSLKNIQAIRAASGEKRLLLLEEYLIDAFAGILHMGKNEITPDDDFIQLGLDSLQFLELNQTLTRELNLRVSARDAYESPYIRALAERLSFELGNTGGDDEPATAILDPVTAVGGEISADIENRYNPFPLTNVQYAYWIGRSGILDLGNVSCHFYFEVERESLDLSLFNEAWNKVIARHDMLRSVILKEGSQRILEEVPFYEALQYDFRGLDEADAEAELEKIRYEKSHQVISSDEWPLFDICVSRLPSGTVRMHFGIELLNADVMSIQIIFTELDAFMKNPTYQPEPLAISFRDYVLAEKRLRQTDFYNVSKNYWLEQIPQMPPAPELPTAKDLLEVENQRFTSLVFEMDKDAWASLKEKTAKRGLTPSGVLLTAYADVLSAWSKNKSFIISLAQFNRIPFHPDVFKITGDFTSILIMAMNARSASGFEDRAKITQTDLWGHLEHRYFDGVEVIREMARGRRMGNEALIPVVFTSILGVGEQSEELYPWAVLGDVGYFVSQTPQVWLDNQVSERDGQLIVSWDVIEEIFPEGMLDDMLDAYKTLLFKLAYDDDAWTASHTSFVPKRQVERFIENNAVNAPVSKETLHQLFLSRVAGRATRPAIVTSEKTLTYEELYDLSNRTAYLLKKSGAEPNRLVAVVMEKGWEQIAAVLGILMSGAAYLPINADLPQERINQLLSDGEVDIVLSQKQYDGVIEWPKNTRQFYIDALDFEDTNPPPVAVKVKPDDIAYVIYTSGSTGTPKGVVIDHRGAVNTILDVNKRFRVDGTDKVLAVSDLSFDLSVYDIFGTLAAGGTIVLPDAKSRKDPAHWWELIKKENITIWNSVPLLMQMLLEYNYADKASLSKTLRLVLMSGDWIPLELSQRIKDVFTEAETISLGGATEASIWSIIFPIEDVSPQWRSIPYGKPMVNQSFHVLDDEYNFCPALVPGRLYIGGVGLAKGYWRDDKKTKERFVTHPRTGERLYHTGDLGRYLEDGNIEFLGREDNQVKIRGYRVELGEIEATLREHEGIKEAAVTVAEEEQSEKRLRAHVVLRKEGDNELLQSIDAAEDTVQLWDTLRQAGMRQAEIADPHLSPETFPRFWDCLDTLTGAVMCETLMSMEILIEQNTGRALRDIFRTHAAHARFENLLTQWLRFLEHQGIVSLKNDVFEALKKTPKGLSDTTLLQEVAAYPEWKPHAQGLLTYFEGAVSKYVSILKGTLDPLELLLSEDALFSAESMEHFNPVRDYSRGILFSMVEKLAEGYDRKETVRVLELGTRAEPITKEILSLLPKGVSYTYTDEASFLLEKTRGEIGDAPFVNYALYNVNEPPEGQNPDLLNCDVIIAANTLHRARHISRSLAHVRSMMAPGGLLVLLEGTRNSAMQLITVGLFEDGFSHFEDDRKETCLPLLSAERWVDLLIESGFEKADVYPAPEAAAEVFGQSVIVAQAPGRVTRFDSTGLEDFVKRKLPEYMRPTEYISLDVMPLSTNGKIDRNALVSKAAKKTTKKKRAQAAPKTSTEIAVAEKWKKVLRLSDVGLFDDFITLGGDSLQATQLINELREQFDADIPLRILFEEATVHKLAKFLDALLPNEEDFEEGVL